MANPDGYRKALRIMKLAEKFGFPVISLIDTPGAYPGIEAEERGQAEAIARNLFEMAQLKVPIVCYIIGEITEYHVFSNMNTRSPTPIPRAPPDAPSPII